MLDCLNLIENSQGIKTFWSYLKVFSKRRFSNTFGFKVFSNKTYFDFQGFQILNGFIFEKTKSEKTLFAKYCPSSHIGQVHMIIILFPLMDIKQVSYCPKTLFWFLQIFRNLFGMRMLKLFSYSHNGIVVIK